MQILIQFPDKKTEQLALGKLAPRFPGEGQSSDENKTAVPSPALGFLAELGIKFTVIGPVKQGSLHDLKPQSIGALLQPYPSPDDDVLQEMPDPEK